MSTTEDCLSRHMADTVQESINNPEPYDIPLKTVAMWADEVSALEEQLRIALRWEEIVDHIEHFVFSSENVDCVWIVRRIEELYAPGGCVTLARNKRKGRKQL